MAQGDQVAVTTRSGGAPDGTLDVRCDVTDPAAVEAAFAEVEERARPGRGAGGERRHHRATRCCCGCREDDWSSVIDTNLTGSFRLAKRAAKGMLRLRRGRIVFISSVVGLLGSAGQVNYAASQGRPGRHGPVASPASSARRSITANVVAPGLRRDRHDRRAHRRAEGGDQGAGPAAALRHARGGRRPR